MDHHKSGRGPKARVSRGSGGVLPQKILKIGSLKKHHFQHSQAEICGKMALKIGDIYHRITLNIPFKLFFWSMTSLQLRCFSKSGHFASRRRSSRDSGFSVKIGTVPPKSGRLDTD